MIIPYVDLPKQHRALEEALLDAMRRVLRHGCFILGPEVAAFERRIASLTGARHVTGVNSGTDALILALRAHGIGAGDEVITVSHSFIATAAAICMVGAHPVFVDIDPETMLMDAALLEGALTTRTRAVMPVHLNGYPCEMDSIVAFCQKHELAYIEDCAQAIGACYRGRHTGTFGTGCFSLHPLKILSACGDAGLITTQSQEVAVRLHRLRNLGLQDRNHCVEASGNTRLDTLQAALLLVKMDYLADWIAAREEHARAYREALAGYVRLPAQTEECRPVYSVYAVRHPRRDRLVEMLTAKGIGVKIHYPIPIHRQEAFTRFARAPLPVTEETAATILSLPVSPELSVPERETLIKAVYAACQELGT